MTLGLASLLTLCLLRKEPTGQRDETEDGYDPAECSPTGADSAAFLRDVVIPSHMNIHCEAERGPDAQGLQRIRVVALQYALESKATALHVFSDSEVVVRQMKGEYACRSPRLYSLNWVCQKLARSLQFSIAHIRRQDNAEANGLANSAVRRRFAASKSK